MKKKFITVLLCLVVALTSVALLAACKNDDNGETSYGAYVLSDKGTYLSYKRNAEGDKIPNLTLLYEQDDALKNTYSMIAVDGDSAAFDGTGVVINEAVELAKAFGSDNSSKFINGVLGTAYRQLEGREEKQHAESKESKESAAAPAATVSADGEASDSTESQSGSDQNNHA